MNIDYLFQAVIKLIERQIINIVHLLMLHNKYIINILSSPFKSKDKKCLLKCLFISF